MRGWFRCYQARPTASTRLICFPHAGGSAAFYRPWASAAPGIEVHVVQYPGRADRLHEPLIDDALPLARAVADALPPLLDRPVALFGHSMGTILAYETARLLAARGVAPRHLFVSAAPAVHHRGGRPDEEILRDKDDDALVAGLIRLGGSDAHALADPQLRKLVLPYVRNDFRLTATYRHQPGALLAHPITAFAGESDPVVKPWEMKRWAELTTGAFAMETFPGDHFYLLPHTDAVLAAVQERLTSMR